MPKVLALELSLLVALTWAPAVLANPCQKNPQGEPCKASNAGVTGSGKIRAASINTGSAPTPAPSSPSGTSFGSAGQVARDAQSGTLAGRSEAENQLALAESRYLGLVRDGDKFVRDQPSGLTSADQALWARARRDPSSVNIDAFGNKKLADIAEALRITHDYRNQFAEDYRKFAEAAQKLDVLERSNETRENNLAVIDPRRGPIRALPALRERNKIVVVEKGSSSKLTEASSKIPDAVKDPDLFPRDEDRSLKPRAEKETSREKVVAGEKKDDSASKTETIGKTAKGELHELDDLFGRLKDAPKTGDKKAVSKADDLLMLAVKLTPEQLITRMMGTTEGNSQLLPGESPDVIANRTPASVDLPEDPSIFERVSKRIRMKATFLGMAR